MATPEAPKLDAAALAVLCAAQFLMVLDSAVMNVSISQLVEDFDTTVNAIQGAITLYALIMAALMITGGKIGDRVGRRRTFGIGMVVYATGSAVTAVSQSVPVLIGGWSVLEGIGAAMVMPALASLVAANFTGRARTTAYAAIGGVAGAGIAVGPLLGGWLTTNASWRVVFVGEVIVALLILATLRKVRDAPYEGTPPEIDKVGSVLSALGMGVAVFGLLQASVWGWLTPVNSPVEPFGFALTPFVIAAGLGLLWAFAGWQRHREAIGADPLVHLDLLKVSSLRSGLTTLATQNTVLMGVFFALPLYLQVVQGLDAFESGVKMLPISVTMLAASMSGPALADRFPARAIVRTGFGVLAVGVLVLMGTMEPELDGGAFFAATAVLGIGMGLIASQLGNVIMSSVGADDRGEAGGLQYTAQSLGNSIGTALIGAVVLGGLASGVTANIEDDPRVDAELQAEVGVATSQGVEFVSIEQVSDELAATDLTADEQAAVVDGFGDAQLQALKTGLLVAFFLALAAMATTKGLPTRRFAELDPPTGRAP